MIDKENLSTKEFVKANKQLFEDVAKEYSKPSPNGEKYTQLNYERILNDMCDFIDGYVKYKTDGEDKYKGKVLLTSRRFFDDMFSDKGKYRKELQCSEIKDSFEYFLKGTRRFQDLMEKNLDYSEKDAEFANLLKLCDNQYRKVSKVCRDDMQIYLWIRTKDSAVYRYDLSAKLRADYADTRTPVIHKK